MYVFYLKPAGICGKLCLYVASHWKNHMHFTCESHLLLASYLCFTSKLLAFYMRVHVCDKQALVTLKLSYTVVELSLIIVYYYSRTQETQYSGYSKI